MEHKEPFHSDSLRLVQEASTALTKAVGAMIVGFPGPLHHEAIALSVAVDELLEGMQEESEET